MTIADHATEFAAAPVKPYEPGKGLGTNPDAIAWKLSVDYDAPEPLSSLLASFLDELGCDRVRSIVIGAWGDMFEQGGSRDIVEALVAARSRIPSLTALFLADVTFEECEISWIIQTEVSSIFTAFPKLEHFRVRGGTDLSLGSLEHNRLRSLVIETGGLSRQVVGEVAAADLPELTHLELWLGERNYGADWTLEDLNPIFEGRRLPRLEYLGLRNCEQADALAEAAAQSAILTRLKTLDLSLGTLGDRGASALLASPAIRQLEKLDLHHHYVSDDVEKKLAGIGVAIDVSDRQKADQDGGEEYRYVAHGE